MSPFQLKSRVGPILFALLFRPLDLFRGHHNHSSVFLPDHAPEIDDCVRQTALCRNISLVDEVIDFLGVCHRCHRTEVAANRRERLGSFVFVVVSTSFNGTLDAHFIQLLAVDALANAVMAG